MAKASVFCVSFFTISKHEQIFKKIDEKKYNLFKKNIPLKKLFLFLQYLSAFFHPLKKSCFMKFSVF